MTRSARIVEVSARNEGGVPVAEVRGEIDASNCDAVFARVIATVGDGPGLVLDLASTSYLDSAGIRILFELARMLRTRRQELRIVAEEEGVVRRVLVLTALADVVELHNDAGAAIAAMQDHP